MSRLWVMAMMLMTWRPTAGVARRSQHDPERMCQKIRAGGGAPASPPVFVQGMAAPTERGVAAASQQPFAPALVRFAFAGWAW